MNIKETNEFQPDWHCLQELRANFLAVEVTNQKDYWQSLHHLEQYDQVFARRIAWKWQAVLKEIAATIQVMAADIEHVIDLGCGSGVAAEILCETIPILREKKWSVTDRSGLARNYTRAKLQQLFSLQCQEAASIKSLKPVNQAFLVGSHVITELDDASLMYLPELLHAAEGFLFVEPGTSHASQRLVALRERMKGSFKVVGPCFHEETCPLQGIQSEDWCHQSLHPPAEIFQSSFWREVSVKLGIDLRSLPVSWLFMTKSYSAENQHDARILGRPKILKASVEMRVCAANGEIRHHRIQKRDDPEQFKIFKKGKGETFL